MNNVANKTGTVSVHTAILLLHGSTLPQRIYPRRGRTGELYAFNVTTTSNSPQHNTPDDLVRVFPASVSLAYISLVGRD